MNPELRERLDKARARSADTGARAEKPRRDIDWADVGKSALTGTRSGLESLFGSLGDIGDLQARATSYGAEKAGLSPEASAFLAKYTNPMSMFASTEDIGEATDQFTGRDDYTRHEATTPQGKNIQTASEFASGLIGGPENLGKELGIKAAAAAPHLLPAGAKLAMSMLPKKAADEVADFFADFTRKVPEAEPGYAYHTSPRQNAMDIREEGSIGTFEPWHGTDQETWPDASVEPRSYWGESPGGTVPFSQDQPTLWRAKRDERFRSERGTRDLYATEPISGVEYYGEGGGWHPAGPAPTKVPATAVSRDDIAKTMSPPRDYVPDDPQSVTKKDYSNPDRVLDPERFHLAGGGVKMNQPFSEMTYKTEPTGGVEAPPQKALDPASLQGGVGIATLGDKTRNFETLVDVNGIPLTRKQKLEGGYRFGDEFPGSIWAGEQVPMGKIMEKAQEVSEGGKKRVFGVPVVQGSEGGDAARMMTGPLLDLMKQAELTPEAKAFLDKAMAAELTGKKGGTRWPGIEEVLANGDEWMANVSMNDRAALSKMMAKSGHANPRVPVAALRKAITAPDLLNRPALTTGMNVGEFDLGKGLTTANRHGTYPVEAAGTSLGRVGAMPYDWMFQTHGAGLKGKDLAQAQRTVMTQIPTQEFNQEWLDNLMAWIEGYQQ